MPKNQSPPTNPLFYAVCSAISFVIAIAVLIFMSLWGRELREIGTLSQTYYILLTILALGAAIFLFGAMKSYASYKGKHLGGVIELGGPAVVVALIIVGGFILAPTETAITITIRVHGPSGPNEVIKEGFVKLDLGNDRREAALSSNGEATFKEVSNRFLGKEVVVLLDSYGFLLENDQQHRILTRDPIYLKATPRADTEPIKLQVAIAVVQKGRQVLILRRKRSEGVFSWGFIGGIIKPNDDPMQRVVDEALKETGLTVKVIRRLGQRVTPETKVSATYFHCEYLSGEERNLEPDENAELRWVDASEVNHYVSSSIFVGVQELLNEIKSKNH